MSIISDKIHFFAAKDKPIHFILKNDRWYNGYVTEEGADYAVINEFKLGQQIVFHVEIVDVEGYTSPGKAS